MTHDDLVRELREVNNMLSDELDFAGGLDITKVPTDILREIIDKVKLVAEYCHVPLT